MKFKVLSDLHGVSNFIQAPEDPETYLIMSGDIDEVQRENRFKSTIEKVTSLYKGVFYVLGNHEYYGSSIRKVNRTLLDMNVQYNNFYVLLDSDFTFTENNQEYLIIGGTLWTSLDNSNPMSILDAALNMNDYKYIRHGTTYEYWKRKLNTNDTINFHLSTVKFIKEKVLQYKLQNPDIKVIVCTHHAPHLNSIPQKYIGDSLNPAYCTDLSTLIDEIKPNVWTHGHIHDSLDYTVGSTRIICNPRGYEDKNGNIENQNFNPNFIFEV